MTISAAILADTPAIYWKLADATGPAASDSSGNGRSGYYIGTVNLAQPGPEAGTTAALFGNGGGVLSSAASPVAAVPMTIEAWVAPQISEPVAQLVAYNGLSTARGAGMTWQQSAPLNGIGELRGGILSGGSNGPLSFGAWHAVALTYDGASNVRVYYDGVLVAGPVVHAWNALGATDQLVVGGPGAGLWYCAHVALFGAALTAARLLAHFTSAASPQNPTTVGFPTASDLAAVNSLLALIYAAVHKTY